MELNKYQTPLTDELLESLVPEIRDDLLEIVNNIEFIRRLISPSRPYAKDLPRDGDGRIIVDLCSPHILEDMDYFRETAIHFKKYGTLTNLRPNPNPNSEFGKWIRTEIDRCWNGMVRESDGEWIPGEMYFYLNYCPIIQSRVRKGTKIADRITDLPEVWEGIYWRFHYFHQARFGGKYNDFIGGQHCAEIAKRGASKSYTMAAILAKLFILGESEEAQKQVRGVVTAYQKEFLIKDGTLTKFVEMIDFCSEYTHFPSKRLKASLQEMVWTMGYQDLDSGVRKGTLNEVIGVSSKDDEGKLRGKRATKIFIEEYGNFPKIVDIYRILLPSVQEGDIAFGQIVLLGTGGSENSDFAGALEMMYNPRGYNLYALPNYFDKNSQGKSESIFFFGAYINRKGCYNNDGVSDVTKALLELLQNRFNVKYNSSDTMALTRTKAENPITIQEAIMKRDSSIYPVSDLIDVINDLQVNPRLLNDIYTGKLALGPEGVIYQPSNDVSPIREFPHKDNKMEGSIEIHKMPERDSTGKVFHGRYIAGCLTPGEKVMTEEGLKSVEAVTINNKLINKEGKQVTIKNLQRYTVQNEDVYTVKMSGILDPTTFTKEHPILCGTESIKYNGRSKVKLGYPERYYQCDFNFKKAENLKVKDWIKIPNTYFINETSIIDNKLWDNLIIRKDCKINNPLQLKDFWWLIGLIIGDGWAESNKNKVTICFNKLEIELINKANNIVKNVLGRTFSKGKETASTIEYSITSRQLNQFITINIGKGAKNKNLSEWIKCLPTELKSNLIKGYLDSDGYVSNNVSEVVSVSKQLLNDIQDILFSLGIYSSLKVLRKYKINFIKNKKVNQLETYSLSMSPTETFKFIIKYGTSYKLNRYIDTPRLNHNKRECIISEDNKAIYLRVKQIKKDIFTGVVYNFECDTHTFMCNYITTHNCDPYDDDVSESMSLGSIFILDLWTDEIVFEYTGRPQFADDFYELCRRALIFYNATCNYENNKKGLFKYFSQTNSLYLLTDTLDFLKDKDMVKGYFTLSNKTKGTLSTAPVKAYARRCIRDWLLKPIPTVELSDGVEIEMIKPALTNIKSVALLRELSQWNSDGNFDRHDALGMMILLREDKLRLLGDRSPESINENDANYIGNDKYFIENYDNRFKK